MAPSVCKCFKHALAVQQLWPPPVMTYAETDRVIHVGDNVLYAGAAGVVVFVIDDGSYSARYPKKDWAYLGKGLGVELQDETRTLYHLDSPNEDLEPLPETTSTHS